MAGSIRFSDSFNGLEDSCKLTYLAFFSVFSCNSSTVYWFPPLKS